MVSTSVLEACLTLLPASLKTCAMISSQLIQGMDQCMGSVHNLRKKESSELGVQLMLFASK